jgi:hypothetical protein
MRFNNFGQLGVGDTDFRYTLQDLNIYSNETLLLYVGYYSSTIVLKNSTILCFGLTVFFI